MIPPTHFDEKSFWKLCVGESTPRSHELTLNFCVLIAIVYILQIDLDSGVYHRVLGMFCPKTALGRFGFHPNYGILSEFLLCMISHQVFMTRIVQVPDMSAEMFLVYLWSISGAYETDSFQPHSSWVIYTFYYIM